MEADAMLQHDELLQRVTKLNLDRALVAACSVSAPEPSKLARLLADGADANGSDEWSMTPLMRLIGGARSNLEECIDLLLQHKAEFEYRSFSALSYAAPYERDRRREEPSDPAADTILKVLLEAGAKIDWFDADGWTTLMWLAHLRDAHAVSQIKCLLSRGADITIKSWLRWGKYVSGSTVVDIAKASGNQEVVELLQKAQPVYWCPDTHRTHFLPSHSLFMPQSFHVVVIALLGWHRTELQPTGRASDTAKRIKSCHADPNNRFWKLPRPLLYKILELAAPPRRRLS